jgi:pyruvate dehydrogenase E2 component (dihydrolipoamide acetyltransferase)
MRSKDIKYQIQVHIHCIHSSRRDSNGTKTAIKFPDLGGAQDVTVIEVLVNVGDQIELDQPLLTLEGDKATMEVPASVAGKIENLVIKVGDKVNEGDLIGHIALSEPDLEIKDSTVTTNKTINLPDLGGASDVTVIEILVAKGDSVSQDQPLITLEGDKATMEVPSPYAGVINEILLAVGDKVNEGDKVGTIAAEESSVPVDENIIEELTEEVQIELPQNSISDTGALLYAGPSVRRLAFEFGVDLNKVKATGPKGRLLKEDLQNYVKQAIKGGGTGIPEIPSVDFTKFGETTNKPLNKIKKLTGEFLTRNWLNIPHVTQHGYVDITDLEKIRQAHKGEFVAKGSRLTLLVFVVRALVKALQEFPSFNSSLSSDGSSFNSKKIH